MLRAAICAIADVITQSFRAEGKILNAANGGSAADAQHIARPSSPRLHLASALAVVAAQAEW
jgi:phosphoheptose isomerase